MARKKAPTLTEAELKIMDVVWRLGEATVADVVTSQNETPPLAYNTILTTMRILEQKGYLDRDKAGRAHVYRSAITRQEARSRAVKQVVKSFFENSPELLMLNILKDESLTPAERKRLKAMMDEAGESQQNR